MRNNIPDLLHRTFILFLIYQALIYFVRLCYSPESTFTGVAVDLNRSELDRLNAGFSGLLLAGMEKLFGEFPDPQGPPPVAPPAEKYFALDVLLPNPYGVRFVQTSPVCYPRSVTETSLDGTATTKQTCLFQMIPPDSAKLDVALGDAAEAVRNKNMDQFHKILYRWPQEFRANFFEMARQIAPGMRFSFRNAAGETQAAPEMKPRPLSMQQITLDPHEEVSEGGEIPGTDGLRVPRTP